MHIVPDRYVVSIVAMKRVLHSGVGSDLALGKRWNQCQMVGLKNPPEKLSAPASGDILFPEGVVKAPASAKASLTIFDEVFLTWIEKSSGKHGFPLDDWLTGSCFN